MTISEGGSPGTFRRFLYDRYLSRLWRAFYGSRYMATLGLLWDMIAQIATDAFRAPMHRLDSGPAYDALRPLGQETSMPQYPVETWTQYRSRLRTDWDTWQKAGDETTIVNQLALAGRPNAQVLRFSPISSWSEFVVFYPAGSHPVTGDNTVGSFTVGDGTTVGVAGVTAEELTSYKDLIVHWKPARWKCTEIIWELTGWTVGTGHTVGEVGLVVGGSQLRTQVQV